MRTPFFTIFIPTFNRAHTLPRAFKSIGNQTFRDFEAVIIDDGSTDGTGPLVEEWRKKVDFPVTYHWQPNQGKHIAHNRALGFAKGELTVILDSDDMLAPKALETFKKHWDQIPGESREGYAGIEGLCAHMKGGEIAGTPFPFDVMDSTYFEIRKKFKVGGDKKSAVRTELLRKFPFPHFPGERHIRPSILWKRLSREYRFRYINIIVQFIEYQDQGLSADRFPLRINNPLGFRYYFLEETNYNWRHYGLSDRFRNCSRYVRYSLHAGFGLRRQLAEIDHPLFCLVSFPTGFLGWIRDRFRMFKRKQRK